MKTKDYIHALSLSNPHIEFATDHSRIYDEFVPSLMHRADLEVSHPQDYSGQETIKLVCSQHPVGIEEYLANPREWEKKQRAYTREWTEYLNGETLPVKEIHVCSAVNQKVFDALCCQRNLESLRIKWLQSKQIDRIVNLKNLKKIINVK